MPTSWVQSIFLIARNQVEEDEFTSNFADLRQIWHTYVKIRVISCLSHVDHVSLLRIYLTIDLGLLDLRNRLTYTWSSSATLFQIRKSFEEDQSKYKFCTRVVRKYNISMYYFLQESYSKCATLHRMDLVS